MEKGLKDIPKVDLNDYKKGKEIGSGGFGRVYLVEHKVTKKKYAAKVNNVKDENVKYVMREIGILSDVHFPTIVNFIGVSLIDFDGNPNATVLLEFYEKGSVDKVFKELDSTSRHIILTGVAHGLKILHSLNIIHRDIKPANVLLDEHLHPYITDFGLSKHFDPEDPTNQTMHGGSPNYMAPEIIKGEAYDNSVDAYAFGILMYEVIVGRRAFYNALTGQRPRFNPKEKINEQLKKLCAACWDENPNERPIFEDIYNALSLKENNDYLLDDANAEEVKKYVEFIENNGTHVDQVKMKELQLEILRAQEPYIKLQDDIKRIRKSSTSKTAFTKKLSAKQSGKNTDNGILFLLKKQEEKNDKDDEICDPLFYPSLSSRDPYDVLLSNWIGFYNSSDTGKFFFELQLQGVIYLTGFIIQSSDKGIPKSYEILVNNHELIKQDEDEQMRDKQYVVIRLKRPVACNQFKFVQKGPNWDGKQYIRLKRIELYTREHPLDENPFPKNKGFFDTYKSLHRTDFNPHLLPVKISTDVFSCEQVENVKTNQVVGTNHGLNEFCEFKFTKGLVTIDSYRLKRLKDRDTLKGWDVIGIKTNGDKVVISSIKEENIDDHKLLDYYPSNDNKTKFQSIRIKNTTENWNGEIKKVLKFHHFDFFGDYYE